MGQRISAVLSTVIVAFGLALTARGTATTAAQSITPSPVPVHMPGPMSVEAQNALVARNCVACHNEKGKTRAGGLSLEGFDAAKVVERAEVAEKMVRKLR